MSAVLVTGGTGTTGSRVARRLAAEGHDVRVGTRSPAQEGEVPFDWFDPGTHESAMTNIDAIYLVAPTNVWKVLDAMRGGLETALALGVRRFALLSSSAFPEGSPMMGEVHAYLRAHAPEWIVLRPSWFMQNLINQHGSTIRTNGAIYTATGNGRVPLIDADDIAAVATRALVDENMPSGELVLTGPEALSYDEVAESLSASLGRPITHHTLDGDTLAARLQASGLEPAYAGLLAALDLAIATGSEDRVTDTVARVTGRPPADLITFINTEIGRWQRDGAVE